MCHSELLFLWSVHCQEWSVESPTIKVLLSIWFFFFKDFIYLFDRDRDSQREREHKQGEWERKKQAHSGRAWCGARSHNAGITPWAEGRRLTAVPPRRPLFWDFLKRFYLCKRQRERENEQGGGAEAEGEADSRLSWEPGMGLNPRTWAKG